MQQLTKPPFCNSNLSASTNVAYSPWPHHPCRAALNGLPADQGSLQINIQGNLGALLLAGNDPEAAIQELQAALEAAQSQQLPLHHFAGLRFNLGKALTTVGRLKEADEAYNQAAQAAYGHDLGSYAKAMAAPRSIGKEAVMQAVQVGGRTVCNACGELHAPYTVRPCNRPELKDLHRKFQVNALCPTKRVLHSYKSNWTCLQKFCSA